MTKSPASVPKRAFVRGALKVTQSESGKMSKTKVHSASVDVGTVPSPIFFLGEEKTEQGENQVE